MDTNYINKAWAEIEDKDAAMTVIRAEVLAENAVTTSSSTEFKTPDGTRYATVIDGAHVIGDVVPTEQGIEAIRDLIAAARKRIAADGLVKLQTESQGSN